MRGWRRRLVGPMALRTATLRISAGSTSGCRAVSLSKLPRASRQTSLSRKRRDAARALAVRQQRHLAHDVAGRDLGHQDRLVGAVLVLVPEHAEAAAGHDIDGVGRLALAEQRRAAGQHEQRQLALDRGHAVVVEIGEQGRAMQRPAQPQARRVLAWATAREAHPRLQALERPADRLVGARPHHLAPLVAGREEALLHVGLELAAQRRAEVAAMMQPVVGAHRAQHLGHRSRCRTRWRSA